MFNIAFVKRQNSFGHTTDKTVLAETVLAKTMSWFNEEEGCFYYFGFGSNLNSKRIHINNPSAVKIGNGTLKDYKLSFGTMSSRDFDPVWTGGTATIEEEKGEIVWGVVWKIDLSAISNLDRQEDVYKPKEVTIEMEDGRTMQCRTYQLIDGITMAPTPVYKQVCIDGAKENKLPDYYIQKLMKVKDNGNTDVMTPTIKIMTEAKKN